MKASRGLATGGRAIDLAFTLLERRAQSGHELSLRLSQNGFPPGQVMEAIARLEELGILDDVRLAEDLIEQALRRGYSLKGAENLLESRGLPVPCCRDRVPDEERAVALARKRLARYDGLSPVAARRRLAGYLMRRGYDPEVIDAVAREVLAEPPMQ